MNDLLQRGRSAATAQWARLMARSLREQLLLVGVLLVALMALADALWLTPALNVRRQAQAQEVAALQALAQAQQAVQATAQARAERDAQRRAELASLRQQLDALNAQHPAAPDDGARTLALLEALVQRQPGALTLVALRALPDPASLAPPSVAAAASAPAAPRVYRHGVEVVMTGRYDALQGYLQALAGVQEPPLRLRSASMTVLKHPTLELTVTLETLSPHAAWLSL